jgi:predicted NUDIX family NTP pyrophosphohydrolase
MRRAAVAKEVEIAAQGPQIVPALDSLRHQRLVSVFPLRARRDLDAVPEQVEAFGQVWPVRVAPMVEGPRRHRVVGHEDERVAVLAGDVGRQTPLRFRVKIVSLGRDVA